MNPSRGGSWFALAFLLMLVSPRPAMAQLPFDVPGFGQDAVGRSPRLVAMGRLAYVLEDPQHRIGLWELGRMPVGVASADSISTVDFGPYARTLTREYDKPGGGPGTIRQDFRDRAVRNYLEAWRRDRQTTYGISATFDLTQQDVPYSSDQEIRSEATIPTVDAILAGRLPFLAPDRLRYGIRVFASQSFGTDGYRLFITNPAGDFIALDGTQVSPPNTFVPDEIDLRTLGIGASASYEFGTAMTAALGYDYSAHDALARNVDPRHASEVREDRPYNVGQGAITGRLGTDLTYGVDVRGWKSNSDQTWVYSTSAGSGQEPLAGRGLLLKREEEGSRLRARALWKLGKVELGAGMATHYRQVIITPPAQGDLTSFNYFLSTVFYRQGADTLATPDSVVANQVDDRGWEAGGGLATTFGPVLVAAEGHYFRNHRDQVISGAGPRQLGWEFRSGLEWKTPGPIMIRAGYDYLWQDLDDFIEQNEFFVNSVTFGLGYQPARVHWVLDAAMVREWGSAAYDHPTAPRLDGQRFAARVRWMF